MAEAAPPSDWQAPQGSPARVIALQGASNFRDLGGYRAARGLVTRWRRLFRSDHLIGLTRSDAAQLQALRITQAIDFRGLGEQRAAPYALPGITHCPQPIEPALVQDIQALLAQGGDMTPAVAGELMRQTYRAFVVDDRAQWAAFFGHLLMDAQPRVFHCTAGKDRTGLAAALLLEALGVERQIIMHDYLLTNALYRYPAHAGDRVDDAVLRVLWTVQPSFLQAAWQTIDERHGDMARYLQWLGLDAAARERLQQLYLVRP